MARFDLGKSSSHGFTIIEALAVVAIILVVAAISTPIMQGVKRSAKVGSSIQNMRQLYLALSQYRADHDGGENYDDYYGAGLPTSFFYYTAWKERDRALWPSPCGYDRATIAMPPLSQGPGLIAYSAMYYEPARFRSGGNADLRNYLETYRGNAVVLLDTNCNFRSMDIKALYNPQVEKRRLGITLSGELFNKNKRGSALSLQFYSELPAN